MSIEPINPTLPRSAESASRADCLEGGGRMGAYMRAFNWSSTPLGEVEAWPQSLRTTVSIMLASGFPMMVVWGRDFIQLYNDAYRPVLGTTKHPAALGQRARDCWPEIWDDTLGPMFTQVMDGGEPIWREDLAFHLDRNGYLEETFFTFSYSAIRDETGRPGGVLVTCVETTERVLGGRRLLTLRELAAQASNSQSVEVTCAAATAALQRNPQDVPFGLIYLLEADGRSARLVARYGIDERYAPARVPLATGGASALNDDNGDDTWRLARVAQTITPHIASNLTARLSVPSPWPEPVDAAAVVPIAPAGQQPVLGILVAGISPRRAYDRAYQDFLGLVASQIAALVTHAGAYEAERQRAEALAQLDRAKTAFFSNVSHEFRTPLTLMLGPIEELLHASYGALSDAQQQHVEILGRNAKRLLKLVNSLLDFSRIEAGRVQASYQLTDLATLTEEIASTFRSTIEHADLEFDVVADRIASDVYVDRDMWEKIVLNLLSNAFKFTLEGGISVRLRQEHDRVVLTIRDSGIGVSEAELPHIFERFYRVEQARGRTQEGSGIGLALTSELVRLHGGSISAESRPGEGTTFSVRLPIGRAHLPGERIDAEVTQPSTSIGAAAFVDEADRWIAAANPSPAHASGRERVLVVDDNADMRAYLRELLRDWDVETVANGLEALALATRDRPDLVICDVMMPGLGGFEILRALRTQPETASIPVLMLSARAGEEARVSGLAAGADDYIVKPFGARELTARVRSLLNLARARRDAELQKQHLHSLFMQAPTPIAILRGPNYVIELANEMTCRVWGRAERDVLGKPLLQALPELKGQPFADLLDKVLETGETYVGRETAAHMDRRGDGTLDTIYFNFVYAPMRGPQGNVEGVLVLAFDVTEDVKARNEIQRLRAVAEAANRTKDEFLAMLGHELRNPLAPILTALQLMTLRGNVGAERERTVIDRQVRHLMRLVDDLLDVSRIARGRIELRKEPVEIAEVVTAAIEAASPLLEARRHRLTVDVPRAGLCVDGDVTRLTQVALNIIMNAAKYTEPNGEINIRASRRDDQMELRVKDSGLGIAPDMLPRVFEMFAQDDQAVDRSQGGLGLGLTIVRSLVELHGGTVEARSEGVGKGTEIIIGLPVVATATADRDGATAESSPTVQPPNQRRILIVDDNADAAHLIAAALTALGHQTRVAFDGPGALTLAARFHPEVALLDLGLPLMDGYELARQLASVCSAAPPVLIAVTGYGQPSDHQRSRAAGFAAHVVKPVDVQQLAGLVDRLIAGTA